MEVALLKLLSKAKKSKLAENLAINYNPELHFKLQ